MNDWSRWLQYVREEDPSACWPWLGARLPAGYGVFQFERNGRKEILAHRAGYRMTRGEIPAGLQLDHLCRNKWCVNPYHLEPVTGRENMRRSAGAHARKTHCSRGHELIEGNLVLNQTPLGRKSCLICNRAGVPSRPQTTS